MTSTCIQPESHHVHITCLWAVFHVQRRKGGGGVVSVGLQSEGPLFNVLL